MKKEENKIGSLNKPIIIAIALIVVVAVIVICVLLLRPSYKGEIKGLVKAMNNEDKLDTFVEKNVDLKALYVWQTLSRDNNMNSLSDVEIEKKFNEAYKDAKSADFKDENYLTGVQYLYKSIRAIVMRSDDAKLKVKEIGKLEEYGDFKVFKKANFTVEITYDGKMEEESLYAIFYKNKLVLLRDNETQEMIQ